MKLDPHSNYYYEGLKTEGSLRIFKDLQESWITCKDPWGPWNDPNEVPAKLEDFIGTSAQIWGIWAEDSKWILSL